jgi:hypothetical protein
MAARLITAYLTDHRDACDSLEGIARWWLPPDTACRQAAVVDALEDLRTYGLVQEVRAADGRIRYRRPTSRRLGDAEYRVLADSWIAQYGDPSKH